MGNAQGMFCGSLFKDANIAINVTPLMIMPFMLFAGFYQNGGDMPAWTSWIMWISNYRYTFEAYVHNNFEYSPFTIDPASQLDFHIGKWECILLLCLLFVIFQLTALLLLFYNKKRM